MSQLQRRTWCGAAVKVNMGVEQLLALELDAMWHADVGKHSPPRASVQRIACVMDCCVPTHSSTESAPMPLVMSKMRFTPSSPRSATMSVGRPNSRARFLGAARAGSLQRSGRLPFASQRGHPTDRPRRRQRPPPLNPALRWQRRRRTSQYPVRPRRCQQAWDEVV